MDGCFVWWCDISPEQSMFVEAYVESVFFSSNSECVRYVYHSTSGDLTCTAQLQKTGVGIQPGWPAKVPKGIILWLALIRVREELLSFVLCQLASPNTMF